MNTAASARRAASRLGSHHALALAFAAFALALRLWHLDRQPLWFDESTTVHIACAPDGFTQVHNTPPLYYLLLRAWVDWFGCSALAVRLPSALAGALFVWATYQAARCVFGPRAAAPAAAFALLAPIHLYYSQEARCYSLLLVVSVFAIWSLWRLRVPLRRGAWLAVVTTSVLALHTHYLAAIPLALGFASRVVAAPPAERGALARSLATAGAIAGLALLPWLSWWLPHTAFTPDDMGWLAILWSRLSGLTAFVDSAELLLLGEQSGHAPVFLKQLVSLALGEPWRAIALTAFGALLLGALRKREGAIVAIGLVAAPLVALWAASFVRPLYCPGRYDLIAFPGLALLVGAGAANAWHARTALARAAVRAALAVAFLALVAKDVDYFVAPPAPDPARVVASQLDRQLAPAEAVVLCGTIGTPVLARWWQDGIAWAAGECRSERTGRAFPCRLLPTSLEVALGSAFRYQRALESGTLPGEFERLLHDLGAPGVWLVTGPELRTVGKNLSHEALGRELFAAFQRAGYELTSNDPAHGITHLRRVAGR